MKKFYMFAVALAVCCAANAQSLQKADTRPVTTISPAQFNAPKKAQSTVDGTVQWGYYTGTSFNDLSCVGYGSQAGEYWVGVTIPANDLLKGTQIMAVDVPIYETSSISGNIKVEFLDGSTVVASKTVAANTLTDYAPNTIVLDEPVTITKNLNLSVNFTTTGSTQSALYPILFDENTLAAGSLMLGDGTGAFSDYGEKFGCYAVTFQIAGIEMHDTNATFDVAEATTAMDTDNTVTYTVTSSASQAVKDIEYTISVAGGEPETRTAKVSIESGLGKTGTIDVAFHSPATVGDYNVDMAITKVNGIENSAANKVTTSTFHNLSRVLKRNVVMEEFTGTGCGYCPRGWAGMMQLNEEYGDRFIGIALHQYNSTDPMYIASSSYPLSYAGAPSSYIDRVGSEVDPGYDSAAPVVAKRLNEVPGVAVTPVATFSDDFKTVDVDATVDAAVAGTYQLVFVLTADGLTGTSFKQSNYYYSYTAAQWGYDSNSLVAKFCNGGEYGKSSVQLTFDDVALATSYKSSANKGGSVTLGTDETGTASYTLTMPTKTALLTAIKNSDYNVYAVVIALAKDGTIANAGKVKVQMPAGINEIATEGATEVARYSLDGRRLNGATTGVNIIRMSDGTSKTVIVK